VELFQLPSEIERRVEELEYKVEVLHELIDDPKHHHFNHVILDNNLARSEVNKIFGLMDEVTVNLEDTSVDEFEKKLYEIIPRMKGNSHFVESVIESLYEDGRYEDVYNRLIKRGIP
jgi:hypothetical protein